MRKALMVAGLFALSAALAPNAALSQGKSGGKGGGMHAAFVKGNARDDGLRGLARADKVAGTHGLKGRDIARTRGANNPGFCPPGQKKKAGLGSRFDC